MPVENSLISPCAPGRLCRRWRVCARCARIRQARIAAMAERLAALYPSLSWSVVHPSRRGVAALAAAKAAWARLHAPSGAIWTVERGCAPGALHLNVLHGPLPVRDSRLYTQHREPRILSPRAVGAYISKREGAPDAAAWPGRCSGTIGPLWRYLAAAKDAPVAAAAAIEYAADPPAALARAGLAPDCQAPPPPPPRGASVPEESLSWEQYREIARRHLPNLLGRSV